MRSAPRPRGRRFRRTVGAVLLLAALAAGCPRPADDPPPPPPPAEWFEDATERLGLSFVHDPGPADDYSMPRSMGSGCAVFDADGDGRPDILLLQNAGPGGGTNRLFRQTTDGRFVNASAGSGLDFAGFNMGAAVGDVDGDGRPDILVTQFRGIRLLLNRGGCRFEDVTDAAGIDNPQWGTSAAFFDYDRDGRLDLVVANYVVIDPTRTCENTTDGGKEFCGPNNFPGAASRLFRNLGPGDGRPARFRDVTAAAGLAAKPGPGLGVYAADLTGDGWPDVFVTNDEKPNHLWVNQRDGTFRDEAVARGIALTGHGQTAANMGVAVGDADGDGLPDLYVTHLTTETNTLWRQGPPGLFRDTTHAAGLAATGWRGTGFGAVMVDFDLDGWPDLALVNGRISRGRVSSDHLPPFWRKYGERNQLLRNGGNGQFEDVSEANPALCGRPNVGRGLAVGDIDGDGRPDLVTTAIAGPARLYLNRSGAGRHWLAVRPLTAGGSLAYGAEVRVVAGGRTHLRVLQPAESYLSSSLPEALFGLGGAAAVDEVRVRWPDGTEQTFPGGPADRRIGLSQRAP
jgi:enediyne biosynthesis protein E4